MKNNTESFKTLTRKLGREINICEHCGADITHSMWMIEQEDRHNVSTEFIKVVCLQCFKS